MTQIAVAATIINLAHGAIRYNVHYDFRSIEEAWQLAAGL